MERLINKEINRPYRYDFFTIWGNGLQYADDILDTLRAEQNLEIVRIEAKRVRNMKKFVFKFYGCDTVPVWHLRAKLSYLFKERPEIIIIFVKNLSPEEKYFSEGVFRHIQCAYIKQIKENIRNLYNPRIDGVRTEEHVIHASDYEEQVDYFLMMLGYPEGVEYLHGDSDGLPFRKPYHIAQPSSYTFKVLTMDELRASILNGTGPDDFTVSLVEIDKTPHFLTLKYGTLEYENYYKRFRYTLLTADHSLQKLDQMNRMSKKQVMAMEPILVVAQDGIFRILDGVHRAAVTLNHKIKALNCVEFSY